MLRKGVHYECSTAGGQGSAVPAAVRRPRFTYRTAQQAWGIAFVLPVLLLFLGFRLYPMSWPPRSRFSATIC